MAVGLVGVAVIAGALGLQEWRRLGRVELAHTEPDAARIAYIALLSSQSDGELQRPRHLCLKAALTTGLMVLLVAQLLPMLVSFMARLALALGECLKGESQTTKRNLWRNQSYASWPISTRW